MITLSLKATLVLLGVEASYSEPVQLGSLPVCTEAERGEMGTWGNRILFLGTLVIASWEVN